MPKVSELVVEVNAKTDKLKKGLKGANKETSQFSKSIARLGPAIAAAFSVRAIINFTKNALNAYDVQAKAEAQLLTALDGRADAQRDLIKQAQELQKITLFGDEETIKAQALIAAFVKEESQIKRIIPLVQDLAAAKGMQLSVAADLVSKTLGSTTNALSRYGIEVKGAVGSTARLESLATGLSSAFEGQAKTVAEAGTGALTQLKNIYGDLTEEIGKAIVESNIFKGIIETSKETVSDLSTIMQALNIQHAKNLKTAEEGGKRYGLINQIIANVFRTSNEVIAQLTENTVDWADAVIATEKTISELEKTVKEVQEIIEKPITPGFTIDEDMAPVFDKDMNIKFVPKIDLDESPIDGLEDIDFNKFFPADSLGFYNEALERYNEILQTLNVNSDEYLKTQERIAAIQAKVAEATVETTTAAERLGASFAQIWASSIEGADNMADAVKDAAKSTVNALIAEGLTALISKVFQTIPFPLSIPVAITAGAVGGALLHGVSKFAQGGIVPGNSYSGDRVPVLANSGEMYLNGTQQNKLFNIINSGSNNRIHVTGRIEAEGTKLVTIIERADRYNSLTR